MGPQYKCVICTFIGRRLPLSTKMCILHIMLNALDHLLAPLCRLLVARGVTFAELTERMKGHYVKAAQQLADGKTTDSRLSVMTGLQRREVARLRGFETKPLKPNHLTRLVALWQADPDYSNEGKALPLPRTGPAPSFETLAMGLRRDVHPRTMLDTLEAAGTIRLSDDGQTVYLRETAYLPMSGSEEQLDYLAGNTGDHLAAAAENVLGRTPPFFERAVHYSGLTDDQARTLAKRFHSGQMALLEELNREAERMKKTNTSGAVTRFRAGGYVYTQTEGET
jgi:hypothetical protein